MAVDWLEIKTEYVNDPSTSYRKLSQKYGASLRAIAKHAKEEGWQEERDTQCNKVATTVQQKTAEKISDSLSDEAASKARIRAMLVKMVENWLENQGEQIEDAADFRRIVQCCVDLGITEGQGQEGSGVVIIDDIPFD